MTGVGQIEGNKTVTQKMIDRQLLAYKTEAERLGLMVSLFNQAGQAIESTSPRTPDKGSVDAAQRSASNHEMRVFLDDRDTASGEAGGISPTKKPYSHTQNSQGLPPQGRCGLPWAARLLAWVGVERGRVEDGCPVCRRRG